MAETKKKSASTTKSDGFTAEEKAAMKERAKELKSEKGGGRGAKKADEESAAALEKIAEMVPADRVLAERLHALVAEVAPALLPKTWYGMPAYARDGKIVCFFQPAGKFKARYSTLGFNEDAKLDDGAMWPTAFALVEFTREVEARVRELLTRAAG